MSVTIKTEEDIKILREGGRLLGMILDELEKEVVPGATSLHIDDCAMELIEKHGLEPMTLGYQPGFARRPYPASTCVSVNEVVVHGIPNENPYTFKEGDVVSLDLVIGYKGLVIDSARTVICGRGKKKAEELLSVTKKALEAGIAAARPGNHVNDIGKAIEAVVPVGYGIVEALCGHGVGYALHEEPQVPNYFIKGNSPELKPGMVLAIEPMIIQGSKEVIFDEDDGYKVIAADGGLSAHMEHTVLITKEGSEVLTRSSKKS